MIQLANILTIATMLLMSCSTTPAANNSEIDPSCLQGHWYYFDPKHTDTLYHEFIFSKDRVMISIEHIGQLARYKYRLNGDTLIFEDDSSLVKYHILTCGDEQLVLVNFNQQTDTLSMRLYDSAYWNAHLAQIPAWISKHHPYGQGDEVDRAFAMRLKEGFIQFDELDSLPDLQKEYFQEIAPEF